MQILASLMQQRNCKYDLGHKPSEQPTGECTSTENLLLSHDNLLHLTYPFYLQSRAPLNQF